MPKNDNFLAGKCPVCLQSPPCHCYFNDQDVDHNITLEQDLPQKDVLEVLIDIKNELADIKRLLTEKNLKTDLEEILKVHG